MRSKPFNPIPRPFVMSVPCLPHRRCPLAHPFTMFSWPGCAVTATTVMSPRFVGGARKGKLRYLRKTDFSRDPARPILESPFPSSSQHRRIKWKAFDRGPCDSECWRTKASTDNRWTAPYLGSLYSSVRMSSKSLLQPSMPPKALAPHEGHVKMLCSVTGLVSNIAKPLYVVQNGRKRSN